MRRRIYAKLLGLAVIEIVLFCVFLMPFPTHAAKLDMPTGGSSPTVEMALDWVLLLSMMVVSIITISALAFPVWLAVRIVRREHATARIPANFSRLPI